MKLNKLEAFGNAANSYTTKAGMLNQEAMKLSKQLAYFKDEMERAKLLNDKVSFDKAQNAIDLINAKLLGITTALKQLDIVPLAQEALNEVDEKIAELKEKAKVAWENMLEARQNFLDKLEALGKLRKESQMVCYQAGGICQTLRKQSYVNSYHEINFGGQHELEVNVRLINRLLSV